MKWSLIIAPPLLVGTLTLLPIIDRMKPWPVGESELYHRYPDGLSLCVGSSSSQSRLGMSGATTELRPNLDLNKGVLIATTEQRSYLILNKCVFIAITESTENGRRTVSADTSRWAFWIIQVLYAGFIWLTVRFSIPKIASKFRQNKSPLPTGFSTTNSNQQRDQPRRRQGSTFA